MKGYYVFLAVKDTNLKANHNRNRVLITGKFAVKDTNLKANYTTLCIITHHIKAVKA